MKSKRIGIIAMSLLTLTFAWLAGCASTASPRLASESLPPPASMSIVLLRLTASVDGKLADPFAGKSKVGLSIANLDTKHLDAKQLAKVVRPVPVGDVRFAKGGWAYLLLAPGDYRVTAVPLNRKNIVFASLPYRLYVPVGRPLLYAGTFDFTKEGQTSLKITLNFEPDAARAVAQSEFSAAGSLVMAHLQSSNDFAFIRPLTQWGRISIVTSSCDMLGQPHWTGRAVFDYMKAVAAPPVEGISAAYDLAVLPIAAMAGTIAGTISQSKWVACARGLKQELVDCQPAAQLADAILKQLQSNGVACVSISEATQNPPAQGTTNAGDHVLQGEIRQVRMVQGAKRGLVATEATLRFRMLDAHAANCLNDQEILLKSGFRNKKEYRGATGRTLFSTQLTALINSGVQQFLEGSTPAPAAENEAELPSQQ